MATIITIGREFGSGGRELGRRLADILGYAYYDSETLTGLLDDSPFSKEYIEEICSEKPVNLLPIHYAQTLNFSGDPHLNQSVEIYAIQSELLRKVSKRNCVIVGRCADYVLRDLHPFRIFVFADMESKVKRCREREEGEEKLKEKTLIKRIKAIDKRRKNYYEFYTGKRWGARSSYDVLINTSRVSIKDIAKSLSIHFKK